MSMHRVMKCDGVCGRQLTWKAVHGLTLQDMEKEARRLGWHAPDKLGRHWCLSCRSESGRIQWWRKENVRRGLSAGYGLGQCTCAKHGPGRDLDPDCVAAGHPGVDRRV